MIDGSTSHQSPRTLTSTHSLSPSQKLRSFPNMLVIFSSRDSFEWQPAFCQRRRTKWDKMNAHFVPGQSRLLRDSGGVRSASCDKMISFCPTESSFGHNGQDRSRNEPTSWGASAENTHGQNEKIPEPQGDSCQSVLRTDSQMDTKHGAAISDEESSFGIRNSCLLHSPLSPSPKSRGNRQPDTHRAVAFAGHPRHIFPGTIAPVRTLRQPITSIIVDS